jgi:peptide/nickel transport system substrate-binding protein
MNGYFTPDTPLYNEVGGEILKRPRDPAAAKAAILQAGYKNEPVVLLAVQDIFHMKAAAEVSGELFRQIGLNVQVVATDFATMASRRANKGPVSQGGWSAFSATHAGTDCINPASYIGLRSSGERAWFGWPDSPKVEAGIRAWFDAPDLDAEKVVARQINADALEHVVFAPTGFFLNKHAWRAELDGVVAAPVSVFWDVTKR